MLSAIYFLKIFYENHNEQVGKPVKRLKAKVSINYKRLPNQTSATYLQQLLVNFLERRSTNANKQHSKTHL